MVTILHTFPYFEFHSTLTSLFQSADRMWPSPNMSRASVLADRYARRIESADTDLRTEGSACAAASCSSVERKLLAILELSES